MMPLEGTRGGPGRADIEAGADADMAPGTEEEGEGGPAGARGGEAGPRGSDAAREELREIRRVVRARRAHKGPATELTSVEELLEEMGEETGTVAN